jgi:hypothetical protein
MIQITDAPAGRVIWLRSITELMAQSDLVCGTRRFSHGAALLNCPTILNQAQDRRFADFFFTAFLLYCLPYRIGDPPMTPETIQVVAGVLAVLLVGIIIMRRKGKKKQEDEF